MREGSAFGEAVSADEKSLAAEEWFEKSTVEFKPQLRRT